MAIKPKSNMKRPASKRVGRSKRGISKFQALGIVAALAIIGVVAVVLSHASGTPDYQYSWREQCVPKGQTTDKADQACVDKSAEAMVYRLYRTLYDRDPSVQEYNFWTQQLAGERNPITETQLVAQTASKSVSDTQFVKDLYKNGLRRSNSQIAADSKAVNRWVSLLKQNTKWNRPKLTLYIASSSESIRRNRDGFTAYKMGKVVTVLQTAAKEQHKRYDKIYSDYEVPASKGLETIKGLKNDAAKQVAASSSLASKKSVTADDLKKIGDYQARVVDDYDSSTALRDNVKSKVSPARKIYEKAKQLADYATDIGANSVYGIKQIASRYNTVSKYADQASSGSDEINKMISQVAKNYQTAESIYIKNQSAKPTNTPSPAPAGGSNPTSTTTTPIKHVGKQCPSNYFPNNGKCWSNDKKIIPINKDCEKIEVHSNKWYLYKTDYLTKAPGSSVLGSDICRHRLNQYAGY